MDPRRETDDRADGAPLDEEQIRADERARIVRQLGAATEEHTVMSDDHRTDGSFGNDSDRDDRPWSRWTPIVTTSVRVDRDHDDQPVVAADPDRDDGPSVEPDPDRRRARPYRTTPGPRS